MAVTWTGAANDNSWNTPTNWSGGAVPVDNDDVIISGGPDITTGLAQSAVELNSLTITEQFRGNIGTPGTALEIDVAGASPTAFRVTMGGGYIYWNGISNVPLEIYSTGGGVFYVTGGTLTGSAIGDESYSLIAGTQGQVRISSGVTISQAVRSAGIGIYCEAALPTGKVHKLNGGSHVFTANVLGTLEAVACNLQTRNTGTGETFKLLRGTNHVCNSSGTITNLYVESGASHGPGGEKSYTVTDLYWSAGGNFIKSNKSALVTVTNEYHLGMR